jgi:hypothetical protein
MNQHVKNFEDRLAGIFERKAEEFARYTGERPSAQMVAKQIAEMYKDLALMMRR